MNTAIAEKNDSAVTTITPMHMLQIAVEKGHDLDRIEKLMELERIWKADQAREAYQLALSEFKKEQVTVTKDKENTQYGSRYTGIGNLVNTVGPAMAPFGLNARWSIDQSDGISVTCILSHTLGHNESVTMSGPPDKSGSKNELQQIKSTITYLKIETFQSVTGTVSQDAGDDDGNAAGEPTITETQVADLEALISEVDANKNKFLTACGVDALEDIFASNYKLVVSKLKAKRNAS